MSSADEKDSLLLITFSCTRCMVDWMMESFVNGPCSTDDIDWWCTSSCVNPHKFVHASLTAIIVCGLETVVTIHAWFDTSTSCNVRIGMCEKSLMVCDASRCWYSFGSIDCIYARSLSSGAAKDNELYNHVDDDVGALFTSWWTTAAVTAAVVLYPCRCAGRAARRNTADDDLMTNLDVDANMVINDIFLCEDEFFSFYSYYSYNCVVRFNENENCSKLKRVPLPPILMFVRKFMQKRKTWCDVFQSKVSTNVWPVQTIAWHRGWRCQMWNREQPPIRWLLIFSYRQLARPSSNHLLGTLCRCDEPKVKPCMDVRPYCKH